ncbi:MULTISPECIES: StsF protein [Streptomyces]|uniref:StsF protein n=1 Tax=Streptomyces TaxID=1883 RepID=UPI00227184DB|nr:MULTISPECIES: StsF protein [unclassified Streptomyces]MCY0945542.1 StsF protein [Streptomyces sp. H34-AA3]MCY0950558.1 StsF protein [Streptomyces sp. H27-S2]MCZ4083666.1 StsF protein [Streptomyces sp. H34-S5]
MVVSSAQSSARLMASIDRFRTTGIDVEHLRAHYAAHRCAQLPKVADVSELRTAARSAYELLRGEPVLDAQEHTDEAGTLGYGFRLLRIDAKSDSPEHTERVTSVFREFGLLGWAERMAADLLPTVNRITGRELRYERVFLLAYREGDYIGPHGAEQDTDLNRFNLQFPLCYDSVGSMRILREGYLEPMYDHDGDARLLGPRMWHEVPPLFRLPGGPDPLRLVVSLRLMAA